MSYETVFYYAEETPPNRIPVGWISDAVERPAETELRNGQKITLNLFQKWRNHNKDVDER